MNEMIFG